MVQAQDALAVAPAGRRGEGGGGVLAVGRREGGDSRGGVLAVGRREGGDGRGGSRQTALSVTCKVGSWGKVAPAGRWGELGLGRLEGSHSTLRAMQGMLSGALALV